MKDFESCFEKFEFFKSLLEIFFKNFNMEKFYYIVCILENKYNVRMERVRDREIN